MSDQFHEEGHAAPAAAAVAAASTAATSSPALVSSAAALSDPTLPATSQDAVDRDDAESLKSAVAATGTITDNPSSEAVTLTGSPSTALSSPPVSSLALPESTIAYSSPSPLAVPSDTASACTSTPSDNHVPPLASVPAAAPAATGASENPQYHHHHVDPSNKKFRPPLANHRSSGASLLTQALASARGIPSSQPAEKEQRDNEQKPTQPTEAPQAYRTKSPTNGVRIPHAASTRHDGFFRQSGGNSITPTSQSLPSEQSMTGVLLSQSPESRLETDSTSTSAIMPGILQEPSLLASHRDSSRTFMSGGRSLERTVKEFKSAQPGGSEGPLENPRDAPLLLHPAGSGQGSIAHAADKRELPSDIGALARPRRVDRTMSMGPEKAWSIDTGAIIGSHDGQGQVEKSITEVLAGVEPTRSRKASHSLRFFKEALPIDKGKRKEVREKPPLTEDVVAEHPHEADEEDAGSLPTLATPRKDVPSLSIANGQPLPLRTSDNTSAASRILGPDYFSLSKSRKEHAKSSNGGAARLERSPVKPAPQKGRHDPDAQASVGERESSESTETREQPETGEDSSEEKISSAVFLPHQGLGEAHVIVDSPPENFHGAHAAPRRSTKEDFHPWLVKADEQEAGAHGGEKQDDGISRNIDPAHKARTFPLELGDECAIEEDIEPSRRPGLTSQRSSRPVSQYYDEIVHDHQYEADKPLEAIELIPYKHQVGGHTTLWRFSKRAVCKQLNNRENEFYENIERYHRDLLPFLPRYIGVLNVTFHKQPRRRSTSRKEEAPALGHPQSDQETRTNGHDGSPEKHADQPLKRIADEGQNHRRVISQSMQQSSHVTRPTVTFVDNRHILPRSLLQPSVASSSTSDYFQGKTDVGAGSREIRSPQKPESGVLLPRRPRLEERHANSWGATTVNKRLRNEVFNDAFLKQPIAIERHQRPASQSRTIPRRVMQLEPRPASAHGPVNGNRTEKAAEPERRPKLDAAMARFVQTQSDLGPKTATPNLETLGHIKDVTGSSAPEPETLVGQFSPHQRRKRRYSGSGLRRKPLDVTDSDGNLMFQSRGNLRYFEGADDAEYNAEGEASQATPCDDQPVQDPKLGANSTLPGTLMMPPAPQSGFSSVGTSGHPSPAMEGRKIPRPVNPKEARAQQSSRVEYFLLMEDLTSGMKRPCIMDLKMGTRQYGVEACEKKRDSQRRKCAATTSRELGVRVCGLQAWDAKSQTYIFKDKYWGRDLKAGDEFQRALTMFLYDGIDYSSVLRHIPTILQKLNQLEATVERLRGYRFYAASLLMFYDGDASEEDSDTDMGESTTDFPTDTEEGPDPRRRQRKKREIDFKMADFANSVTPGEIASGKPCPPKHPDQADGGFLRGLRTLKKYFLQIQKDVRDELGLVTQYRHSQKHNHDEDLGEEDEVQSISD